MNLPTHISVLLLLSASTSFCQWGGELRFCLHSEPRTLHPALADDDAAETIRYLTSGVLVRVNRVTQQLQPELALAWKVSPDGRTIRFQLREGVRFSDGTPFTADDVAFTLETLLDPGLHSAEGDSLRTGTGKVQTMCDGEHAITLRFPAPLAGGVRLFDQIAILSRRSPLKPGTLSTGATLGPFRMADRSSGAYLQLVRNPNYWKEVSGRKLPYLDSIRLDVQKSHDAEFLRFARGEVHLMSSLDIDQFDELARKAPETAKDAGASLENEFLWFNLAAKAPLPSYEKAWFAARDFRTAISHAIRRDDLCKVVYHGHAAPGIGPFPKANFPWFNSRLKSPVWDLGLARRLLSNSGFYRDGAVLRDHDGHIVEFSLLTNAGNKNRERIASLLQQDLAALGIRLNIVTLDFPSLLERIGKSQQYEACLLGFNNVDPDPDGQMNLWLSSSSNHAWNPRQSSPGTPWEAEIDRLMREQASAIDPVRRKNAFDRVQEIVAEESPILYLLNPDALVAYSSQLRNVQPAILRPRLIWNIEHLYLARSR